MNELGMTSADIKKRIEKEENYIKRCQAKINDLRFDISATERCIKWWNKQLKIVEKKERK